MTTATPTRPDSARPWRRFVPWQGRATRTDVALMATILAMIGIGIVMRPFKPFLLAAHPVALEFLTGDKIAIGAAAAFARIGEVPLWLVVVAGTVGMVKFDWIMWWAGRQWGAGIVMMFTTGERMQRFAGRAKELNPWIIRTAIVLAGLPGIPSPVVFAMAGMAGTRLRTFLLLDAVGAALMTGIVAGLGYAVGRPAVDAVLLVDSYAGTVSLTMIAMTLTIPLVRRWVQRTWARGGASMSTGRPQSR